jgi:DNA-binding transcriptional MocR family regulator
LTQYNYVNNLIVTMTIWRPTLRSEDENVPLYGQIAQAIEADVLADRLHAGDRLPTHRDLARALKVTVGTVSRGYAEARKAGWISGEVGNGTFVLDRNAGRFPPSHGGDSVVDLGLNVPIDAPAPDLAAAMRAMSADDTIQSLVRYTLMDTKRNRLAGASVLERHGLEADPDQVVLCAGTQHGLGVALEAVAGAGDTILAEELTYPGFRPLAEARGLRIAAVGLDDVGIDPKSLDAACRKGRPRALYIVPTCHNPTTLTLPLERRKALVQIARRHDLMIIEDDVYRMLEPQAPPPLARLAPERTIYVTSLSKCLAPGLRVGYMVAPAARYERIVRAIQDSIWMVSPITTALATHWVQQGEFERIAAAKRKEAAARQALAARLFPRQRPKGANAAYHLWLATGSNAEAFTLEARAQGVIVTPGSAFYLGSGPPPKAVRVSLSAAPDRAVLTTALEKLAGILKRSSISPAARL